MMHWFKEYEVSNPLDALVSSPANLQFALYRILVSILPGGFFRLWLP